MDKNKAPNNADNKKHRMQSIDNLTPTATAAPNHRYWQNQPPVDQLHVAWLSEPGLEPPPTPHFTDTDHHRYWQNQSPVDQLHVAWLSEPDRDSP